MAWDPAFESAFHPQAVAIVGASASGASRSTTRGGANFIRAYQQIGFPGRIYPVNPHAEEVLGRRAFPSVSTIPEPVDYVIVSVPAPEVPAVLEDCARAGAKNVHVYTAGFRESGAPEGVELERRIAEIARRERLRLVGPNSMGLCYVPRSRMSIFPGVSPEPGEVAFLSQSGGHCLQFIQYARGLGVRFSKVISYGNGIILDSTDFLEYLAKDPETRVLCVYVEGVRDGRRLLELVKATNPVKPVVLWKGGLTQSSARAAASHTGSLAGEARVWDAFFKQTGALAVYALDDMADLAMTLVCNMIPPRGRRAAIVLSGGGYSVLAADTCAREGLEVPEFTPETQRALREFIPPAGNSIRNPVDAEAAVRNADLFLRALELAAADPVVDLVIVSLHLDMLRQVGEDNLRRMGQNLVRFARENPYGKSVAAILDSWGGDPVVQKERSRLLEELPRAGVPVFRNLLRASRSLAKLAEYYAFLRKAQGTLDVPD